jgi:hypothetical protein
MAVKFQPQAPAGLYPRKISATHFCQRLSRPQDHSVDGRSTEKPSDLIGNQTCNLPACSIVPQPTMLPHAPKESLSRYYNVQNETKQKLCGLSPQANYTGQAAAACRRS